MNTELLLKVKQHILEEPKRLMMGDWLMFNLYGNDVPACGTVGCIAGWAVALSIPREQIDHQTNIALEARKLLRIDREEVDELFYVGGWDNDLNAAYYATTDHGTRAHLAATAIDRFIAAHR